MAHSIYRGSSKETASIWECQSDSVILEVAQSQSGETGLVINKEGWQSRQPCEVDVHPPPLNRTIPYGALQVVRDDNGEYHVVVKPEAARYRDKSFEFKLYTTMGGNPASPMKPYQYLVFESKSYPDFFMTWDINGTAVKCKQLKKTPEGYPDITISSGGDVVPKTIQVDSGSLSVNQYVWVVPTDEQNNQPQFALKAYGRSYFLMFGKANNKAVLIPGEQINPEVTIFRISQ